MPRIAITSCKRLSEYESALKHAGGTPILITPDMAPGVLQMCDGLLLTGGGDVSPALYGEAAHPTFHPAEPKRDELELALAKAATEGDMPMLAICRGIQVLNVARGGTLIQDVPSERPDAVRHEVDVPPFAIAHTVTVIRGTQLERMLGARALGPVPVNSRHHQAIKALGRSLIVSAVAPDGIIEAVEDPSRRFIVGVQWHPESFWKTGEFACLFQALVTAATPAQHRPQGASNSLGQP